MAATERTPLTRPRNMPNYVEFSSLLRNRRARVYQFQCCICATLLAIFVMALVAAVSYSINHVDDDDNNGTTPTNAPTNLLKSFWTLPSTNTEQISGSLTDDEWTDGLHAGQQAIDIRQAADVKATPLLNPSPNSRHQYAVSTSVFAGELALAGIGEIAATQAIEHSRQLIGKPSSMGAYFDGGWAPRGSCKEFSNITCTTSKYRNIDGTCNHHKHWGSSLMPFRRSLPPDYSDGINAPRKGKYGNELPSAREVSLRLHPPLSTTNPSFTVMLAVFGQFLDHDITATAISQGNNGSSLACCPPASGHPECFPVPVGKGDPVYDIAGNSCMEFVRSAPAQQCKIAPREQLSQVTAFIDGSVVYGNELSISGDLREGEGGRLKMQRTPDNRTLLPPSTNPNDGCNMALENKRGRYCFASGDKRANENLHLTTMHLLWARQHNRVANDLAEINPHWDDETLYQEARRIVGAQMQHIAYNEFVPIVLGEAVTDENNLKPLSSGYRNTYDPVANPTIANNFAAAAFRFAHTLLPGLMRITDAEKGTSSYIELHRMLFNPYSLYTKGGVESSVISATTNTIQQTSTHVTSQLTRHMFEDPTANLSVPCGLDLVSLNVQRGRDHGLPGYTAWREHCGFRRPLTFSDLSNELYDDALDQMSKLYASVDDVDLYTGALAEIPKSDGLLGPTFTCLLADQFLRLQKGDRYWYETSEQPQAFTEDQLQEIRKSSLAKLICECSDDVTQIQSKVMRSISLDNPVIACDDIPGISTTMWKDDIPIGPSLKLADAPSDWVNFKNEINSTIQDIISNINASKPPTGDPDWSNFKDYMNKSFSDLRNEIASLYPKPVVMEAETNIGEKLENTKLIGGIEGFMNRSLAGLKLAVESTIADDWVNFKSEINKSLSDAIRQLKDNMPPAGDTEWVMFEDMVKDQFADIKDQISTMKPKPFLKGPADNGTFDWFKFKSSINKTINDIIKNEPLPGDPGWVSFRDFVNKSFSNIKNDIADLKPKLTEGELLVLSTDWLDFKSKLNKSVIDSIKDIKDNAPFPGDPAWAAFRDTIRDQFAQIGAEISTIKPNMLSAELGVDSNTADLMDLKNELEEINSIVKDVNTNNKPPPGGSDLEKFGGFIDQSFTDIKNSILDLKPNQTFPLIPVADWISFKSRLNDTIINYIRRINNSDPTEWTDFQEFVNKSFSDIRNDLLTLKNMTSMQVVADKKNKSKVKNKMNKYLDVVKERPKNNASSSENSAKTYQNANEISYKNPATVFGKTFDWIKFKTKANITVNGSLPTLNNSKSPPGNLDWPYLQESFVDTESNLTALKYQSLMEMVPLSTNWTRFQTNINKTIADVVAKIKAMTIPPAKGTDDWTYYREYVNTALIDLQETIDEKKKEFIASSSQFLHIKHSWMNVFRLAAVAIYLMY